MSNRTDKTDDRLWYHVPRLGSEAISLPALAAAAQMSLGTVRAALKRLQAAGEVRRRWDIPGLALYFKQRDCQ